MKFIKKHEGEILLGALVLYVIVLGVATIDEVFDLGYFPPPLEKQVIAVVDRLDTADERVRADVEQRLEELEDFVVIPVLIRTLSSSSVNLRKNAGLCLRNLTGVSHGYQYDAPKAKRKLAIKKWKQWWRENEDPTKRAQLPTRSQ